MQSPKKAGELVDKAFADARRGKRISAGQVRAYWKMAAGERLAGKCSDVKLERQVLKVHCDNDEWRAQAQRLTNEILASWRSLPGAPKVKKIVVS